MTTVRYAVVTGDNIVEVIRTDRKTAEDDARLLKDICGKNARVEEYTA